MFATGSAPIHIAGGSEGLGGAFAELFGLEPAVPRFATTPYRFSNRVELIVVFVGLFVCHPGEHWLDGLAKAVVPVDQFRGKFGDLSGVGIAARIGELAEEFLANDTADKHDKHEKKGSLT